MIWGIDIGTNFAECLRSQLWLTAKSLAPGVKAGAKN